MILLGYKLSYKALPSLKNSGQKIILLEPITSLMCLVYPTGIVDFITIIAFGFTFVTTLITASTAEVSKKFFSGS